MVLKQEELDNVATASIEMSVAIVVIKALLNMSVIKLFVID